MAGDSGRIPNFGLARRCKNWARYSRNPRPIRRGRGAKFIKLLQKSVWFVL